MRLFDDLEIADDDLADQREGELANKQLPDECGVGRGIRKVEPEPLRGKPAPVGERDADVSVGAVLRGGRRNGTCRNGGF